MVKTILLISGLDPCGGAGIHADIKTARAIGLHSASVVTSLTVQNTCRAGDVNPIDPEIIREQLNAVFEDLRIDCVKIGLVPTLELASAISEELVKIKVPKVLDPVLIAGTGGRLGSVSAYEYLLYKADVDVTTPNLSEAQKFAEGDAERIAIEISRKYGCNVVITGGELGGTDIVCEGGRIYSVTAEFSPVTIHGTGCVYSTALACYLGIGNKLEEAVRKARIFVLESVKRAIKPGSCYPVVNP